MKTETRVMFYSLEGEGSSSYYTNGSFGGTGRYSNGDQCRLVTSYM